MRLPIPLVVLLPYRFRLLQARHCTASSSVGGVAHRRRVLCPITRNTPVTSLWLTGAMVELCQSTPPPSEAAQGPSQHSPTITNLWLSSTTWVMLHRGQATLHNLHRQLGTMSQSPKLVTSTQCWGRLKLCRCPKRCAFM